VNSGLSQSHNARRHGNDAIARNHDHGGKGLFQKPKLLSACIIYNNNKILEVAVDRHFPENRCRTEIKPTCATVNPWDKSAFGGNASTGISPK